MCQWSFDGNSIDACVSEVHACVGEVLMVTVHACASAVLMVKVHACVSVVLIYWINEMLSYIGTWVCVE